MSKRDGWVQCTSVNNDCLGGCATEAEYQRYNQPKLRRIDPKFDPEFYQTPYSAVRPLIDLGILPLDGPWLEPFAGDGSLIRAVPEVAEWWALELREEEIPGLDAMLGGQARVFAGDFFSTSARQWIQMVEPQVIITNPPNSRAFDAARLLREWCPESWLVFLQPVGFGGGRHADPAKRDFKRLEWFSRNCPDHYRLAERPDFSRDGSGGIQDYAWFVWPPSPAEGPDDWDISGYGWEYQAPYGFVRREGVHRILPPSGWAPSAQGVLL